MVLLIRPEVAATVTTGWIENVLVEFTKVYLRSNQVLAKSLVSSKKEIQKILLDRIREGGCGVSGGVSKTLPKLPKLFL